MTTQNWPNPTRPGVPMFPERDGWHLITFGSRSYNGTYFDIYNVCWWEAALKQWRFKPTGCVLDLDDEGSDGVQYVGPVLNPTQINEMLAAERERCAKECDSIATFASSDWKATAYDSDNRAGDAAEETAEICAQAIRNLGAAS